MQPGFEHRTGGPEDIEHVPGTIRVTLIDRTDRTVTMFVEPDKANEMVTRIDATTAKEVGHPTVRAYAETIIGWHSMRQQAYVLVKSGEQVDVDSGMKLMLYLAYRHPVRRDIQRMVGELLAAVGTACIMVVFSASNNAHAFLVAREYDAGMVATTFDLPPIPRGAVIEISDSVPPDRGRPA